MSGSLSPHRPLLAVALKLGAIGIFTMTSALIKAASEEVPAGEAVFFRSAVAIPVLLVWLAFRGELRQGLVARNPRGHFFRGLFGTCAMGLSFGGLALLPLPEVTAIGFATPIFTLLLAAMMLGERIRAVRLSAVGIGLVGVLIMLWPRIGGDYSDGATLGALMVLGATLMRALVQIHIRQLVQTEHTAAVVFYFSAIASLLSLLTLPFGWVVPSGHVLMLLVAAGIAGGIAQMLVTSAYRYGPASMLAPYDYSSMIFAIILGYVWFAELPTLVMLTGAALVIAGNVLVIWREHQLGIERARARSVSDPKA